ncbi:hypothetical protein KAW96_10945 [candidate division WOR-3 bacterium]|nr:hypothetical protein [candidate division WOR-3 bacterium]
MKICYKCKKEIEIEGKVGREELCPYCGSYLHCCLNCRFYDDYAHNKCREPRSEWVSDRERGNFCGYFKYKDSEEIDKSEERKKKAKEELKKLFGKDT